MQVGTGSAQRFHFFNDSKGVLSLGKVNGDVRTQPVHFMGGAMQKRSYCYAQIVCFTQFGVPAACPAGRYERKCLDTVGAASGPATAN